MTKIKQNLVALIDNLAPLNNKYRREKNALKKVEILWMIGEILSSYLKKTKIKLNQLLLELYDPHSTNKKSNITRDLGSYSYRIFKYFNSKQEIKQQFDGLNNYSLFREAIPLLFNQKYELTNHDKKTVIQLIKSKSKLVQVIDDLRSIKKKIRPLINPRNQKAYQFTEERNYLIRLKKDLLIFYKTNEVLLKESVVKKFGKKQERLFIVKALMALSNDIFMKEIADIKVKQLSNNIGKLLKITKSKSDIRARFRKWAYSTKDLLFLSEGIYSLEDKIKYNFFRSKLKNEKVI